LSIIYDALKRIDKPKENNAIGEKAASPAANKKNKTILLYVLIILVGLFLGNLVFSLITRPKIKTPQITKEPKASSQNLPVASAKTTAEEIPAPSATPSLVLNGVFFEKNKGYALINNRILYAGEQIEGATVKEITLNKVNLDFDGKTITLNNLSR
jgi:type II secretory pathway component PulC